MLLRKLGESSDLFPWEFCERTVASESPTEILSEDLLSGMSTQERAIKILPPKQMLQRLAMLLAQVKAGNTSENLLNEIRQIAYLFYWVKQISKKVCNIQCVYNIQYSITMCNIFMNSETSKTSMHSS